VLGLMVCWDMCGLLFNCGGHFDVCVQAMWSGSWVTQCSARVVLEVLLMVCHNKCGDSLFICHFCLLWTEISHMWVQ
jgi:hypothetical protein